MTENQRRAQDLLTIRDVALRAVAAIGLIVAVFIALLAAQPF